MSTSKTILFLITFSLLATASFSQVGASSVEDRFVQGEILVKFKPGTNGQATAALHRQLNSEVKEQISGVDVQVIQVAAGEEEELIGKYRRNPNVLFAEPNYVRNIPEPAAHQPGTEVLPGDHYFEDQWGLHNTGQEFNCFPWINGQELCFNSGSVDADIDAPEAWAISTGTPSIKVAILDSGIDSAHPDLAGKVVAGYDFYNDDSDPSDDNGHGTHVAGIVAAALDNLTGLPAEEEGIAGVAPDAALLAAKVCGADGTCDDAAIASGIDWSVTNGAKVINLSLGDPAPSETIDLAIQNAWQAGVVVVAAAGNNGSTTEFYPAAIDNVIAVGAFDEHHQKASFSNFGNWVDISAPGNAIISSYPLSACGGSGSTPGDSGCYTYLSGTSMASPHVAGAAALIWSLPGVASASEVRDIVLQNADPIGVSPARLDSWTQFGGLNIHEALGGGAPSPTLVSIAVAPAISEIEISEFVQFTATGTYDDASEAEITNGVTWSSSDPGVSSIDPGGEAQGLSQGSAVVTAELNGVISNAASLVVNSAMSPYGAAVLADAPVGYWRLGESGGTTAADSSGNGYHGTYLNGSALGAPGLLTNDPDTAVDFDGGNDYVDLGKPAGLPDGTSPRSIEAWCETDSVASGYAWCLAYGTNSNSQAFFIGRNGDDLYVGGYGDDIIVPDFWQVGVAHHLVATYDGTIASVYVDGVLLTSEAKNWNLVRLRAYIGRQVNNGQYWDGTIDEVAIYNVALSQSQVASHYQADVTPEAPDAPVLSAEGGDASVSLSWTVPAPNGAPITAYNIYRGPSIGNLSPLTTVGAVTSYDDLTAINGTAYFYAVAAINVAGEGATSEEVGPITPEAPSPYEAAVLADAPVGYWRLGESGGTTAEDSSGNGYDGSYANGPTLGTPGLLTNDPDTAVDFDGGNDYVDLGNPAGLPDGTSPRSIEAWCETDTVASGYAWCMAYGRNSGSQAFFIGRNGDDLFVGGYGNDIIVPDFWQVGVAHHIVATYDGVTASIYVDGVLLTSEAKNWNLVRSLAYIGRQVNNKQYWDGTIDEVAIYDVALSQSQVASHYQADVTPEAPDAPVLSAEDRDALVSLSWTVPAPNGAPITAYNIYRGPSTGTLSLLTAVGAVTNYDDDTAVNGTAYFYAVAAVNVAGEGTVSNEVGPVTPEAPSPYEAAVLADAPVGYWRLGESGGTTAKDSSGNGYDGAYVNGPTLGTPGLLTNDPDTAVDFDGKNDYVDLGNPSGLPDGTSSRSIEAWCETDTVASGYAWCMAYGRNSGSQAFFIGRNGDDLYVGGYGNDIIVPDFWQVGVAHHIVATYDGTTASVYVDGVLLTSETKNWNLVRSRAYIGRQVNKKQYWNGIIDEVAIYDVALSPTQIAAHFDAR